MMGALRVFIALGLPWLAGFIWLRILGRRKRSDPVWIEVGYGHFLGLLLLTLLMRIYDKLGLGLSFGWIALALALITTVGVVVALLRPARLAPSQAPAKNCTHIDPFPFPWLAATIGVLLVLRLGPLVIDVLTRPLFPWDAWTQWGTKAKVWSYLRELAPFISYDEWLARSSSGYVDTAPRYPATIPLLQTWISLAIGSWDDALMNVTWLASLVALGVGIYGQFRAFGVGLTWSLASVYAVLSLPMLDTHVALAGYADFHVGAAYALAVLALIAWEQQRIIYPLILMASVAFMLPLLKIPGIAWVATLLLGASLVAFGSNRRRAVVISALLLTAATIAVALVAPAKLALIARPPSGNVFESLLQNLFLFGNWNLLWYVLPLTVAVGWRHAIDFMRGASIALLGGLIFLAWTFLLTQAGDWVVDYTTVNRALLHIAPALTAFMMLLLWKWMATRPIGSPDPGPRTSSTQVDATGGANYL